jgi:hypothetical protein
MDEASHFADHLLLPMLADHQSPMLLRSLTWKELLLDTQRRTNLAMLAFGNKKASA